MGSRTGEAHASRELHIDAAALADGGADKIVDAYRQYLRHLKNVWEQIDPETLRPEELGAIAQGINWVAGVVFEVSAARGSSEEIRG